MTKYNSFIVHNDILYTDMDIEEIERKVEISLYDKETIYGGVKIFLRGNGITGSDSGEHELL